MTCRHCGVQIRNRPSGFCGEACRRLYCCTCRVRLPEGRRSKRCRDCNRAGINEAAALPFCSRCRRDLPEGWVSRWCSDCRREYRNGPLRLQKREEGRSCATTGCREALPAGRWSDYCTDCERARRRALASRSARKARGLPPVRFCPQCEEPLPNHYRHSYCPDCRSLYNVEYWSQYPGHKECRG